MSDEDQHHDRYNTEVTRWPHSSDHPSGLPEGCEFVCSYVNDFGIDQIDQAVFLKRTGERDELWIAAGITSPTSRKLAEGIAPHDTPLEGTMTWGLAVSRDRYGTILSASIGMLEVLVLSGIGYSWPKQHLAGGIVDGQEFDSLVARMEIQINDKARDAKSGSNDIVTTATELRLNPRPSDTGPNSWTASCPGTNHPLRISAESNTFGCGWCKRTGGPDVLEQFVADRKAAKETRQPAT
jgi:hypothetical protein